MIVAEITAIDGGPFNNFPGGKYRVDHVNWHDCTNIPEKYYFVGVSVGYDIARFLVAADSFEEAHEICYMSEKWKFWFHDDNCNGDCYGHGFTPEYDCDFYNRCKNCLDNHECPQQTYCNESITVMQECKVHLCVPKDTEGVR